MVNNPHGAVLILEQIEHKLVISAVEQLSSEQGSRGRTGGVLVAAVIRKDRSSYIASVSIGDASDEKVPGWAKNANEKIWRLHKRRTEGHGDIAASQSADGKTTYGGCVVFDQPDIGVETYISFSGAPPDVDEAIAYAIGVKLGGNPFEYDNPLVPRALELLNGM